MRRPQSQINISNKIKKATNDFVQKQQRNPTAEELSEIISLEIDKIEKAIQTEAMLKTINSTDTTHPGHFMSQYIAQSRKAIRQTSFFAKQFIIDRPQNHNGKILIPFAAEGGTIILDATLENMIVNL